MNKFVIRQSCLLFLTALIWGVAFVAQSVGMDYVEPFTFNAVRCTLGGIVLIPCIGVLTIWKRNKNHKLINKDSIKPDEQTSDIEENLNRTERKNLIIGGIVCGILLFISSNFQQVGIQYTTAGKAGFITALYIVIVPVLGIFLHRRSSIKIWIGVAVALFGLYLLCIQENFTLGKGDGLVLVCAVTFSFHIMVVDYFSPKVDGIKMSCIQFFVCGILSSVCMFLFETPHISQIISAWLPILYAGVMSCGIAYTLQIIAQEGMNPTVASLILSMEAVVSVLAGWILLHEKLSVRELTGCVFMFAAIILAQLPQRKKV
ncbi:MAG: DMT family transporter [Lachnospiraceae bacterium]|nr:DMT family transporter [Lachnospiraceae bacterium]